MAGRTPWSAWNRCSGKTTRIGDWAARTDRAPWPPGHPLHGRDGAGLPGALAITRLDRAATEAGTAAAADGAPLVLIQNGANLGFAAGNNVGLRYALAQPDMDYVWLLNNDTVVEPDCLSRMLAYSTSLAEPNTCGSLLLYYDDPRRVQALGGCSYNRWTGLASTSLGRDLPLDDAIDHPHYQQRLDYIAGASWLLPRAFLQQIGLMEESYFLYCEEVDWCLRNAGRFRLVYAPDARVYHKEGSSIGSPTQQRASSLLSDFYIFRNKLRVTRKFFPWALPTAYLTSLFQAFNRARRGQWDKAWLILRVLLGKRSFTP
jgi:GT2 family glycosyltransferase